ncbi:MAG: restriction endonuclease [Deltaproteobacteria bacterium]|jgi:restriction endonuclease Mrr|nr:restriction endonuclease [Deltaproteobacteria bacterium]
MHVPSLEAFLLPVLILVCEGQRTTARILRRMARRLELPAGAEKCATPEPAPPAGEGEAKPPETDLSSGERKTTPPETEQTSGEGEATSRETDRASGKRDDAPLGTDQTSGEGEATHPETDQTSGVGEDTPRETDQTSGEGEDAPRETESAAGEWKDVPRETDRAAGEEKDIPPEMLLAETRIMKATRHLMAARLIKMTRKGRLLATDRGRAAVALGTDRIDFAFLRLMPGYEERLTRARDLRLAMATSATPSLSAEAARVAEALRPSEPAGPSEAADQVKAADQAEDQTPAAPQQVPPPPLLKRVEEAFKSLESAAADDLAEKVRRLVPESLHQLAIRVLTAMSQVPPELYTDAQAASAGMVPTLFGEEALEQDSTLLGLRSFSDGPVSRNDMETLEDERERRGATRCIMVSTAPFTREATEFAGKNPRRIAMVGLKELAQLMLTYDIGVISVKQLELKAVDHAFFEEARGVKGK